jgi:bis(5'-nucleosyl)-tetraphosphatase (symmetrical)
MTTHAIGSVKGNYQLLLKLLEKIQFDPENDSLWFTGNLVNEGPESLAVLRFVKDLGKKAVTVLGDREMYLLALAEGFEQSGAGDTLDDILNAPDRDELLKWLRRRSFIHHDSKLNFTLVHAGIPVEWSFSQALTFSYEVESVLSMNNYTALLENRQRDQSRWSAKLRGWRRLRFIVNAFTLMKYYKEPGRLDFDASGAITAQAEGVLPWYRLSGRLTSNLNIVFADDAHFEDDIFPGVYPLPAQESLSALKLEPIPERISVA